MVSSSTSFCRRIVVAGLSRWLDSRHAYASPYELRRFWIYSISKYIRTQQQQYKIPVLLLLLLRITGKTFKTIWLKYGLSSKRKGIAFCVRFVCLTCSWLYQHQVTKKNCTWQLQAATSCSSAMYYIYASASYLRLKKPRRVLSRVLARWTDRSYFFATTTTANELLDFVPSVLSSSSRRQMVTFKCCKKNPFPPIFIFLSAAGVLVLKHKQPRSTLKQEQAMLIYTFSL